MTGKWGSDCEQMDKFDNSRHIWHKVLPHLEKASEHLQKTELDLTNTYYQTAYLFERVCVYSLLWLMISQLGIQNCTVEILVSEHLR